MKYRKYYICIIVALASVIALVIWNKNIICNSDNSEDYKSKQVICVTQSKSQIDLVAARLKLLEDMKLGDLNYDLKVPIEFFGKVLDQHDNPVRGAEIQLSLSSMSGIINQSIYSREDGAFSLTGIKGKFLSVNVFGLEGYTGVRSTGYRDYNYAIPGEFNFHVPNPNSPVIFRIWKYEHPEPLRRRVIESVIKNNGSISWINIDDGTVGESRIGVSYLGSTHIGTEGKMPEIRVVSGDGCSIWETNDDPMFSPPEVGSKKLLVHEFVSMKEEYRDISGQIIQGSPFKFRLYFRAANGKYSAIKVDIRYESEETDVVSLYIYQNPSGSRNLEYDPKLEIREMK